ncbi:unnamed protein product (mitochondrion) [Plasmodiophora brassicae]|uniref:Uncharacterized protein n=1 Tax=Plasmodiophora brassicae TaxID=37360 RepID=A0A3P3YD50_PLABS|nr:unnamed protein product [Plasmodiophora brassicae]
MEPPGMTSLGLHRGIFCETIPGPYPSPIPLAHPSPVVSSATTSAAFANTGTEKLIVVNRNWFQLQTAFRHQDMPETRWTPLMSMFSG